jgi:hypothetical protein
MIFSENRYTVFRTMLEWPFNIAFSRLLSLCCIAIGEFSHAAATKVNQKM